MKLCPTCQRHLRSPEPCCPFCGAEQRSYLPGPPAPGGAGLAASVLLGVMLSACGDRPLDPSSSSSDGSGGASETSATGSAGTSTSSTTATQTTDAPTTTGPMPGTAGTTLTGPTTDGTSNGSDPSLDAGDEGCQFYAGCPPDVGPSKLECDPFVQDCADGQKCAPWTDGPVQWNATKCVPVTGDKQPGQACAADGDGRSGLDDCGKGSFCWEVDGAGEGHCVALCGGNPEELTCGGPDEACLVFNPDALFICSPKCDPLVQGCPDDDVCVFAGGDFLCVLDASGDKGAANDACEFNNGCNPGLVCLSSSDTSASCDPAEPLCCTPFCELPDAACPNPDQTCVPFLNQPPAGHEDVGVCMIMR